jgi:ABC-2 type transport system ATP-binding protein
VTASLPVPNDVDPEEPDSHEGTSVVALPTSPQTAGAGKASARKPPRKKPAPKTTATAPKPRSTAAAKAKREPARPAPPAPPSAPTAPSDLETAERAAADLVIPPKPPLPDEILPAPPAAEEEAPTVEETPPAGEEAPPSAPELEDEAPAVEDEAREVPAVLAPPEPAAAGDVLVLRGVSKRFGDTHAVDGIDLTVPAGTFYGLVGPNGAGKTTTLSMIAGLLVPDRGSISVGGVDAASDPVAAKRLMGVLPDRLRTFDRLTGRQLLYYYGVLRGLAPAVVESRTADLARAFDLTDALGRVVSDYSAGMVKKVMLAGALIHSPRVLVLDEPFEAVDPVSSAIILDILSTYVAHGGTVILSSHGMELVERVCSRVAVIVAGQVLAEGTVDEVRGELSLEQRFIELAGGLSDVEGLEWLHTFSD